MKLINICLIAITTLFFCISCAKNGTDVSTNGKPESPPQVTPKAAPLVPLSTVPTVSAIELINNIGWRMLGRMSEEKPGENIVISPVELAVPMAVLLEGARGETEREISKFLNWGGTKTDLHLGLTTAINAAMSRAQLDPTTKLESNNRFWVEQTFTIENDFLRVLDERYSTQIVPVDFLANASNVAKDVNDWGRQNSHGLLDTLLQPDDLNAMTRFVNVNLLFFSAEWLVPFNTAFPGSFRLVSGKTVSVPLMTEAGIVTFVNNQEYDAIRLPYAGEHFSMIVMAPKLGLPFPQFEKKLQDSLYASIVGELATTAPQPVDITLPKFSFSSSVELLDILELEGITTLRLREKTDLSGISPHAVDEKLHISKIGHAAKIVVNENGTLAAGATTVVSAIISSRPSANFDRPMVFAIQDDASGMILFLGRLMDPSR